MTPFEKDTYSLYRTFYDNEENISATIDSLGNITRYNFNNRGFLISVELGAGTNDSLLTRYAYDEEGRLKTTVTGLNNILDRDYAVKNYEYDSLGRLVSETDPGGNQTFYEYDGNGNILKKTDRNGVTIEYKYDGLNRIISKKNSKDGDEKEIKFAYDLLGNTVKMSDVNGTTIYEYDNLGRVSCIDYEDGIRQMYSYDSSDQVTNLRLERNGIDELDIIYGYDNLGRLSEVEDKGRRYVYRYDKSGRLKEEVNDHTGFRTLYEYYPSGKIKSLVHRIGGDILGAYNYGYNQNGNMVYEVTKEGSNRYYYDNMSRLDAAIMKDGNIQQYEYDDFNNIKRLVEIQGTDFGSSMIFENTYIYDVNGRLLSKKNMRGENVEELFFTYDNEGNQLTKEVVFSGANGQVLSQPSYFGYNGYNQLERFTGPDNITTRYFYNGIGLRTDKITGKETRDFYYSNGSIILETENDGKTL